MNINIIRKEVEDNLGKKVSIKYNLGRNKTERYNARIKETYSYIFIVELEKNKELKSFSYSDIITKTIKMEYK